MKTHLLLTRTISCLVLLWGPLHGEDSALIEPPWTDAADGYLNKGEYIDLNIESKERVLFQHCAIADTGVQIERVKGNEVIWRRHVKRLGVIHSGYIHHVGVRIWRDVIYIESRGEQIIYETRKLSDGSLIRREIRDTKIPIENFLYKKQFDLMNERSKEGEQPDVGQPPDKPADKVPSEVHP